MKTVAIIDYGSGNLRSAEKAFERAIAEAGLDFSVAVTADPDLVRRADRIVLPGVGAFGDCRRGLDALPGMVDTIAEVVRQNGRPFLGICVGMQLLATWGREHGDTAGLDWLPGEVVEMRPADSSLKIPHMGWNELVIDRAHPLLDGLKDGAHAYFVHSYRFAPADPADVKAHVEYGDHIPAVIARDNIAGTQFHPEKSQETGLRLITNFLRWTP